MARMNDEKDSDTSCVNSHGCTPRGYNHHCHPTDYHGARAHNKRASDNTVSKERQ